MTDLSKIYNMIWTAGFNSGLKVNQEVIDGKLNNQEEVNQRAQECLKEDAEGIMMLLKLENEMNK